MSYLPTVALLVGMSAFNFWDVDELSSSEDDEYTTPSSPSASSSSVTLDTPSPTSYANKRTSRAVQVKQHAHRPSITNIRLPVEMSDDELNEDEQEHKQQTITEGEGTEEEEERTEEEEEEEDSSQEPEVIRFADSSPPPSHRPSTSPPAYNTPSRSDKEATEEKEELPRRPSSSGGIIPASVTAAADKPLPLTPSPPPVPPRRSSNTAVPLLSLSSTHANVIPHFPPPPSSVGRPTASATPSASPPLTARASYPVASINPSASSSASLSPPLSSSTASLFPVSLTSPVPSNVTTAASTVPSLSSPASSPSSAATFSSHLRHAFEPVSRQSTTSVYSTKRLASLLKRLAILDETYIRDTSKTSAIEEAKRNKPPNGGCYDGLEASRRGWDELDRMLKVREASGLNYCDRVMREVVLPLLEFYQEAEERRKRLVDDEKRATADMNRYTEEVARNLSQCVKLVTQAKQQLHEESESSGSGGGALGVGNMKLTLTKHFRQSVQTITANAVKAARAYNDSVVAANSRQQRYVKEEMPALFGGLEAIERGRLALMKDKMLHWTDLQIATLTQQLTQLQQARRDIEQHMDVEASVQSFIATTVSQHGRGSELKPYVYQLGVSIRDMEEGRLEPPVPTAPTMSLGVFGVPLSVLMEREEERAADSDTFDGHHPLVPHVVRACEERLSTPAALATEGIFRISIPKPQLEQLRTAIDREEYDAITTHSNPHAAACVLKDFLRSLPHPLIADELYDECVTIGMERGGVVCDERTAMRVWSRVGEYERRVLTVLGAIGERVVSEESVNRMGVDNLAIVFAPCLLRNRSEDMGTLLAFTKYEAKFTAALLKGIIALQRQGGRARQSSVSVIELDFD